MQLETLELDCAVRDYINEYINKIKESYEQQIKELQNKYLEVKEQLALLVYKRFVRSAEQLQTDKSQPLLFTEEEAKAQENKEEDEEKDESIEVKSHKRNKKGRKAIDANIERRERIIDIDEEEKTCACGAKLTRIGEEKSEKLVIVPAQIYVDEVIRPKYACRACEGTEDEDKPTVRIAPVEPSIIPRSIVSPSLLSYIMIQKYEDHLPFYRQETQFERIGITISRQDMCNWQQKGYEKVSPIFTLLKDTIKTGEVIQMDETTLQVIGEESRQDTQKSYMWLALGGPPDKKVALYEYRETRAGGHAKKLLNGFTGYLQTDGYEGYDSAVKDMPEIIQVGCFTHVRRKFFEAAQIAEQSGTAKCGIEYIRKLYHIENKMREEKEKEKYTDEEFVKKRKELAEVVLNDFKTWLNAQVDGVPPSCLLGKAIRYSLRQWDKLTKYLESPYLTPDNNAAENAIRPFVLGRKNWLFNQSPIGAESSCGMYSLIQTAKLNGLVPLHYLTALFQKAPFASSPEDWKKLLPWNIFNS